MSSRAGGLVVEAIALTGWSTQVPPESVLRHQAQQGTQGLTKTPGPGKGLPLRAGKTLPLNQTNSPISYSNNAGPC